jgi:O-6-methylguanine DNA methyltransferase
MERVHTTRFDSPIGVLRLAATARGLAYLELPHASGRGLAGWCVRCAPEAKLEEAWAPHRAAVAQILEYLDAKRTGFDLPLDLRGTPFQLEVWHALLRIPYGEMCSYADVAREIGRPTAVRAVGAANGANPIPLVVPCHRVIAADRKLGGYGGGLELKARLLAMERSRPRQGQLL